MFNSYGNKIYFSPGTSGFMKSEVQKIAIQVLPYIGISFDAFNHILQKRIDEVFSKSTSFIPQAFVTNIEINQEYPNPYKNHYQQHPEVKIALNVSYLDSFDTKDYQIGTDGLGYEHSPYTQVGIKKETITFETKHLDLFSNKEIEDLINEYTDNFILKEIEKISSKTKL